MKFFHSSKTFSNKWRAACTSFAFYITASFGTDTYLGTLLAINYINISIHRFDILGSEDEKKFHGTILDPRTKNKRLLERLNKLMF